MNQTLMENILKDITKKLSSEERKSDIVKMMNPYFVSCNYEEKSFTLGYEIKNWELNPQNTFHGGMISTAFDNAFGILTSFYAQGKFITTVELGVHFHKSIHEGDKIEVIVKANHIGKTLASFSGEMRVVNRDNILASTATTTFIILEGKKAPELN